MSADTLFDPDSYLVAENTSPRLTPAVPSFENEDTPPPVLLKSRDPSPAAGGNDTTTAKRRRRTEPSQSDTVLLRTVEPNRLDIANYAGQHALDPESEAEDDDEGPAGPPRYSNDLASSQGHGHSHDSLRLTEPTPPSTVSSIYVPKQQPRTLDPPAEIRATPRKLYSYNTTPPPSQPRGSTRRHDEDKLSPLLADLCVPPSDADPENTLTPIQRWLPRSQPTATPYQAQSLPSLKSLPLSPQSPYSTCQSPDVIGGSPVNPLHYSHLHSPTLLYSPPTSEPALVGSSNSTTISSATTPPTQRPTARSVSSSSSAVTTTQSPHTTVARPPLPLLAASPVERRQRSEQDLLPLAMKAATTQEPVSPALTDVETKDSSVSNKTTAADTNSNNTTDDTSIPYKCNFKGCKASPFPTQYLLNSHRKVHSEERPHFCPVPDCPRGRGGQGFKRKNEMTRHRLVHNSPGYTCPFCPGQQHKYPRADNLRRHVKTHHGDDKLDLPELKEVTDRRPEGGGGAGAGAGGSSSRGRRRRFGA